MANTIGPGVEVLTAWLDNDDDTGFAMDVLEPYLHSDEGMIELLSGLLNIGGALLMRLERLGEDPREVLRDIALRWAERHRE